MDAKSDLKNLLASLMNAKFNAEDIVEVDIVLKTKTSMTNYVERFEEKESPKPAEVVDTENKTIANDVKEESPVVIEPIKKERKKRAPKTSVVEEKVVETTHSIVETEKTLTAPTTSTPTKPTGIARIVKLVTFFCKGQNINPADITIALLKEKAFDIIEGYDDATVQAAIDEFKKAMVK